jgi:homoserine O-acetyltransferase
MELQTIELQQFELQSGARFDIDLSYQVFGQPLHTAPVVLVNHALTGNSQLCGSNGWWQTIVGSGKVIDTDTYTVVAFNIPGNGFGEPSVQLTKHYTEFTAADMARSFIAGLDQLQIDHLYAIIGGSLGGGLVWELAKLRPQLAKHLVPIAADWKATDWLVANCYIQDQILNNSSRPVQDARRHAMTFYRTPESLNTKFQGECQDPVRNVKSWLDYHGEALERRFSAGAYKMMNQLLKTIRFAETREEFLNKARDISGHIHLITINSDLLFKPEENWNSFIDLKTVKDNVSIGEIKSIHGHDAFLIEHQQLTKLLKPIFQNKQTTNDHYKPSYIRNW